jgi:adenosyl cobinamide kinase/adenosyl cobinamide phosphate guanylyltransferase
MAVMSSKIILITGGVKSGKSTWALKYGEKAEGRRVFLATAEARDDEMRQRIEAHKIERANRWKTIEEPLNIDDIILNESGQFDVLIIDCLTMWISNMLTVFNMEKKTIVSKIINLTYALEKTAAAVVVVTNEVSMGIMPADPVSRVYQELLGRVNRDVAGISSSVYFMVSGIPQKIK